MCVCVYVCFNLPTSQCAHCIPILGFINLKFSNIINMSVKLMFLLLNFTLHQPSIVVSTPLIAIESYYVTNTLTINHVHLIRIKLANIFL